MKKVLNSFIAFLLTVLLSTSAFAFQQQDNDSPVKTVVTENLIASSNVKAPAPTYLNEAAATSIVDTSFRQIDTRYKTAYDRLKDQATSIKEYAKANNYNADYCFLVDMSIPSGKKRLFIYNMKKDSVEYSSLVAHGFGSYKEDCDDRLVFSNTPYSFKTSLGKYKIGYSYNGTYGLAYKLHGLDSTNNRAFERAIVLHSDTHVPDAETYPFRIFQSAGCPTVSPAVLPVLGGFIKASKKPMLMWIYN